MKTVKLRLKWISRMCMAVLMFLFSINGMIQTTFAAIDDYYDYFESYTITISNGTATDETGEVVQKAVAGTEITITANEPTDDNTDFYEWNVVSGNVTLEDTESATTTFIMPDEDVSLQATYIQYIIISGGNSVYALNSENPLHLGLKGNLSALLKKFKGIAIDGAMISSEYITSLQESEDVSRFSLAYDFLKSLSLGEHTLTFKFANEEVSTKLTVKDNDYEIIPSETGKSYATDSEGAITFHVKADHNKFSGVKVDDVLISKDNYETWEGSTYVKLKSDYAKTLSVGDHKITFVYTDGEISTSFTLANSESTASASSRLKTGDNSNVVLVVSLIAVSALGVLIVLMYTKKKKLND